MPRKGRGRKKTDKEAAFDRLDASITASRTLPTVILFDAVWHAAFAWLQKVSKSAAEYLQTTYFKQLDRASLQRQFWCDVPVWHGTNSGSGSGTQTLESFHSYWQEAVKQSTRADPRAIFGRMERLFRDDWSEKFAWSEARVFQTWPQCPAQELLNGQALRTAGRLPAVDFWNNREPKLCGFRNYYKIHRRTDSTTTNASGQEGITTFWVMRCFKKKDLAPAQATITKEQAEMIAGLIAREGAALKAQLHKAGILTTSERPETLVLRSLLCHGRAPAELLLAAAAQEDACPLADNRVHLSGVSASRGLRARNLRTGAAGRRTGKTQGQPRLPSGRAPNGPKAPRPARRERRPKRTQEAEEVLTIQGHGAARKKKAGRRILFARVRCCVQMQQDTRSG